MNMTNYALGLNPRKPYRLKFGIFAYRCRWQLELTEDSPLLAEIFSGSDACGRTTEFYNFTK